MLVLTRKNGQRVHIGPNIIIEVVESRTGKVRIGVIAPKDVKVVRDDAGRKAA